MIEEARFRQIVAAAVKDLGRQIDAIETDDLDWKLSEGVLSVEFENGGVFVLSQQVPVRELWLSAFSRAWHFRVGETAWLERDTGRALGEVLSELFASKLGMAVGFTEPPLS